MEAPGAASELGRWGRRVWQLEPPRLCGTPPVAGGGAQSRLAAAWTGGLPRGQLWPDIAAMEPGEAVAPGAHTCRHWSARPQGSGNSRSNGDRGLGGSSLPSHQGQKTLGHGSHVTRQTLHGDGDCGPNRMSVR